MSDIIPADQLRIHALEQHPDIANMAKQMRGGQHVGMSYEIALEHEPSGTIIIVSRGPSQFRNRQIAIEAMEFILTHPNFK